VQAKTDRHKKCSRIIFREVKASWQKKEQLRFDFILGKFAREKPLVKPHHLKFNLDV